MYLPYILLCSSLLCAPAELTPLHPGVGVWGEKSMMPRRKLGPSAHLRPALGARRAKIALHFFLWQLQGRQRWEKEKGEKEKKVHSILFNLCFRHYCSEMENHHIKELFENQRLQKTIQAEECFPNPHSSYRLTDVAVCYTSLSYRLGEVEGQKPSRWFSSGYFALKWIQVSPGDAHTFEKLWSKILWHKVALGRCNFLLWPSGPKAENCWSWFWEAEFQANYLIQSFLKLDSWKGPGKKNVKGIWNNCSVPKS